MRSQYMLIFGGSLNATPWLYCPEILPLNIRAQGTAIAVFNSWIWVSRCSGLQINRWPVCTNSLPIGLCDCHDYSNHSRKSRMEVVPHLHVHG